MATPISSLAGRVALVTGAGMGIGRGIGEALAARGATVAFHASHSIDGARDAAEGVVRQGGTAIALQGDLTQTANARRAVDEAVSAFGRLDILVNNAGTFDTTPLFHVTEEMFDAVLATDFRGPFFIAQAAARQMVAQQGGTIISLASGVAKDPDPGYFVGTTYAGAKTALWRASQRMAMELGPFGVRVNVIVPGFIHSKRGPLPEYVRAEFAPLAALKRTGTVDDIARVALFLASDDAAFITGQTLVVDGGIRMH
jgi:3-oxoacyl-[acyl-carrier protein] reductase